MPMKRARPEACPFAKLGARHLLPISIALVSSPMCLKKVRHLFAHGSGAVGLRHRSRIAFRLNRWLLQLLCKRRWKGLAMICVRKIAPSRSCSRPRWKR